MQFFSNSLNFSSFTQGDPSKSVGTLTISAGSYGSAGMRNSRKSKLFVTKYLMDWDAFAIHYPWVAFLMMGAIQVHERVLHVRCERFLSEIFERL